MYHSCTVDVGKSSTLTNDYLNLYSVVGGCIYFAFFFFFKFYSWYEMKVTKSYKYNIQRHLLEKKV